MLRYVIRMIPDIIGTIAKSLYYTAGGHGKDRSVVAPFHAVLGFIATCWVQAAQLPVPRRLSSQFFCLLTRIVSYDDTQAELR